MSIIQKWQCVDTSKQRKCWDQTLYHRLSRSCLIYGYIPKSLDKPLRMANTFIRIKPLYLKPVRKIWSILKKQIAAKIVLKFEIYKTSQKHALNFILSSVKTNSLFILRQRPLFLLCVVFWDKYEWRLCVVFWRG